MGVKNLIQLVDDFPTQERIEYNGKVWDVRVDLAGFVYQSCFNQYGDWAHHAAHRLTKVMNNIFGDNPVRISIILDGMRPKMKDDTCIKRNKNATEYCHQVKEFLKNRGYSIAELMKSNNVQVTTIKAPFEADSTTVEGEVAFSNDSDVLLLSVFQKVEWFILYMREGVCKIFDMNLFRQYYNGTNLLKFSCIFGNDYIQPLYNTKNFKEFYKLLQDNVDFESFVANQVMSLTRPKGVLFVNRDIVEKQVRLWIDKLQRYIKYIETADPNYLDFYCEECLIKKCKPSVVTQIFNECMLPKLIFKNVE